MIITWNEDAIIDPPRTVRAQVHCWRGRAFVVRRVLPYWKVIDDLSRQLVKEINEECLKEIDIDA